MNPPRTIILALNRERAEWIARHVAGLARNEWRYVGDPSGLRGIYPSTVDRILLAESTYERQDARAMLDLVNFAAERCAITCAYVEGH